MEEQAKQALSQLLERAVQGVDSAVAFSQAQVPDVVEQLLMWKMVESALPMAIAWIVFAASTFLFFRGALSCKRGASRDNDGLPPYEENEWFGRGGTPTPKTVLKVFFPGASAFFSMAVAFGLSSLDWLQILIAPKLYLLEYAASLVK